jgi:DNA sulfur modification protein DndB
MSQQQQERTFPPLILPGLRARIGDWMYYICFLKMQDIAMRISIEDEIHDSETASNLQQREFQERSAEIAGYLLSQQQRFLNALVVATYKGKPNWYEIAVDDSRSPVGPLPDDIEGTIGFLRLEGTEKLFAIDGQHRIAGIREALEKQPELWDEEVCVIFLRGVPQEHRNADPAGFERTRRLFATLNRQAKSVSENDVTALDKDYSST